jgi:hypothetical protein
MIKGKAHVFEVPVQRNARSVQIDGYYQFGDTKYRQVTSTAIATLHFRGWYCLHVGYAGCKVLSLLLPGVSSFECAPPAEVAPRKRAMCPSMVTLRAPSAPSPAALTWRAVRMASGGCAASQTYRRWDGLP